MDKSIEIEYYDGKVYIPDVTVYDSVSVIIATNEPYDRKHKLKLKRYIRDHDILDDEYEYYIFSYEKLKECLEYYEKIKDILKRKLR